MTEEKIEIAFTDVVKQLHKRRQNPTKYVTIPQKLIKDYNIETGSFITLVLIINNPKKTKEE